MIFSDSEDYDLSGWERQTTTDEPRLSELTEFYEELGQGCTDCMRAEPDRYRTIYTRPGTRQE